MNTQNNDPRNEIQKYVPRRELDKTGLAILAECNDYVAKNNLPPVEDKQKPMQEINYERMFSMSPSQAIKYLIEMYKK